MDRTVIKKAEMFLSSIRWLFIFLLNVAVVKPLFSQSHKSHPNFIIILCEDLGYGDIDVNGGLIPTLTQRLKELQKQD